MRILFALVIISLTAGSAAASHLWVNNITVNEFNMTWGYTETFTGLDSIVYRIDIDSELGNNDSFINAWELLKADKELRKRLRESINREPDIRIDNKTSGIEIIDVDSKLSPDIIGKTHSMDTIVNKYDVTYRFEDTIFNASSIWFLGQAKTPITVVMPVGVDVVNTSGMDNATKNITDHTEISGFFKEISRDRGEITLSLTRNTSVLVPGINISLHAADNASTANLTKPVTAIVSKIRDASIVIVGAVIILLIYFFKVKRR